MRAAFALTTSTDMQAANVEAWVAQPRCCLVGPDGVQNALIWALHYVDARLLIYSVPSDIVT